VPGASNYFKGAIVSYATEIKEKLLHVDHELIEEKGVVSEEVAKAMVAGACDALDVDFAISSTGVAGPSGGTAATPVGTIWLAYGCKDDIRTLKLSEDNGRDINLTNATNTAIRLFLAYVKEKAAEKE
jgi:nicotinamide-nucleotide amidase